MSEDGTEGAIGEVSEWTIGQAPHHPVYIEVGPIWRGLEVRMIYALETPASPGYHDKRLGKFKSLQLSLDDAKALVRQLQAEIARIEGEE